MSNKIKANVQVTPISVRTYDGWVKALEALYKGEYHITEVEKGNFIATETHSMEPRHFGRFVDEDSVLNIGMCAYTGGEVYPLYG